MTAAVLPGRVLDARASDPELVEKTPVVSTRLGPAEMDLLRDMAMQIGVTRSNLTRRLLVQALLELRNERRA